jgi:hypothetical protein
MSNGGIQVNLNAFQPRNRHAGFEHNKMGFYGSVGLYLLYKDGQEWHEKQGG